MSDVNRAQSEYWTSAAGLKWLELEDALDATMAGMLETVLVAAAISKSDHVLDVGCGTGASTLAAARLAADGRVLAVDIAAPLLARAKRRSEAEGLENTSFLLADAQTHDFAGNRFDVLISRLGMSFFADPVAAFENLARAMQDGGRMVFVSWADVQQNPWFKIPKLAAEAWLGSPPKSDPAAPGPTAFQDTERVVRLMQAAGLTKIVAQPVEIILAPPNGIMGAARTASRVGPAARVMQAFNGTTKDADAIEDAVAEAFQQFEKDGDVLVPAVVNLFTCTTQV